MSNPRLLVISLLYFIYLGFELFIMMKLWVHDNELKKCFLFNAFFLDTHVSLAPTHVSLSVRWSVRPLVTLSDFQSASVSGRPT